MRGGRLCRCKKLPNHCFICRRHVRCSVFHASSVYHLSSNTASNAFSWQLVVVFLDHGLVVVAECVHHVHDTVPLPLHFHWRSILQLEDRSGLSCNRCCCLRLSTITNKASLESWILLSFVCENVLNVVATCSHALLSPWRLTVTKNQMALYMVQLVAKSK